MMAQDSTSDLHEFGPDIWTVEGGLVRDTGMWFTTRMTVVKLSDGSVWLDSPVPVPFTTLNNIVELGPVRYLIAATPRHAWRLASWHTLFPNAQLWSSRITPMTLKKATLPLSGILGDQIPQGWADDIDQLVFRGNPLLDEVVFFHKKSHTAILDDLIQVHSRVKGKPLHNALVKLGGVESPHGGVARDIRASFINRNLARQSIAKLLSWDFDKLVIAHGPCIEKDAKPFVERAFRWLKH
jgi:hypothetical protein